MDPSSARERKIERARVDLAGAWRATWVRVARDSVLVVAAFVVVRALQYDLAIGPALIFGLILLVPVFGLFVIVHTGGVLARAERRSRRG